MRRFQSRLDALHRLRHQKEQLARADVAVCRKQLSAAEEQTANVEAALRATSAETAELLQRVPGAETLNATLSLYRMRQEQLHQAKNTQQQAAGAVQASLTEWQAAQADLKVIDNRIQQQRATHRRNELLHEEHNQQEAVSQKAYQQTAMGEGADQ